jgi:hypothetical protein
MGSSAPSERRLYSVGHSNHELPAFLDLLELSGVTAIADVRSSPFSRRLPQFNRPALEPALRQRGIAYAFLGAELGGRPASSELYDEEGRADYGRMRATEDFARGLDRLCRARAGYTVAMMCGEADAMNCHRGLMVAPALVERGVAAWHLRKDGSVESTAEFEERLLAATGVGAGMLDGLFAEMLAREERQALVAEAYRRRGKQVAYRRPREDAASAPPGEDGSETW